MESFVGLFAKNISFAVLAESKTILKIPSIATKADVFSTTFSLFFFKASFP